MPSDSPRADGGRRFDLFEDADLVAALVRGERPALGALFDRHAGVLLAFGTRLLGDPDRAEALLHDVFLAVWHHARDFNPAEGTVRSWLFTRLRAQALAVRVTAAASETPLAAVFGLPEELSAVLALAYFEGVPTVQIAARLGISVPVAQGRLQRALALLRERDCGPVAGNDDPNDTMTDRGGTP